MPAYGTQDIPEPIVKRVPRSLNIANFFTVVRLASIPFAVHAILSEQPGRALAIVLVAGLTDAVSVVVVGDKTVRSSRISRHGR